MGRAGARAVAVRVGLAAAAAGMVATLAPPAGAKQLTSPVVTPSIQVTKALRPGRAYTHGTVLVHPKDPKTLVIADADFTNGTCDVHVSRDGGRTWADSPARPVPPQYKGCTRPAFGPMLDAEFGPDGTLYYAGTASDSLGAGPTDGYLARSTDLGATWQFTVVARSQTREFRMLDGTTMMEQERFNYVRIAVHPTDPERVYVGYRVEAAFTAAAVIPTRSVVTVSVDGGQTFGPPVDTVEGTFPRDQMAGSDAPAMAVAPDGTIYAFTKERPRPGGPTLPAAPTLLPPPQPANLCQPASANPNQPAPPKFPTVAEIPGGQLPKVNEAGAGARLLMSKSTDDGKTWKSSVIDDGGVVCIPCLTTPEAALDPKTGNVYVVFELSQQGLPYPRDNRDIFFMRSTDAGASWTKRMILNDDSDPRRTIDNPNYDQLFPGISIAPNGRIDVAWHDFRTDGLYNSGGNGRTTRRDETCWDVFYTYSTDGGNTWAPNLRISDRTMNQNEGFVLNLVSDLRGPMGVASTDEAAFIAWPDSRAGAFDLPTEDTYLGTVLFDDGVKDEGSGVDGGSVALGVAVGLVVAGLAVAAVAMKGRGSGS